MPQKIDAGEMIENRTFDEMDVGDSASLSKAVTQQDIDLFALVTGDINPAHVDPVYAATDMFHHVIAHGLLGAGLISGVLGTRLPGPGTIYLSQDLRFRYPVSIGDIITATVTVTEKHADHGDVTLDCRCENQDGRVVVEGAAHVRAPKTKVSRPRAELPDVRLSRHAHFRAVIDSAGADAPLPAAIVWPCDAISLSAAVDAAKARLIVPILVGERATIVAVAASCGAAIAGLRIVDAPDCGAAAVAGVALVKRGEAALLMKGALHTDELLKAVLAPDGLRCGRRLSHVYLMDVPGYPRPLLVTDAAVNIEPDLLDKRDIIQNAIDLAHVMGIAKPRVALLAAVETVNPKLRSTLDAGALCKMADRGQITGGVLDGPLAFDNAISPEAAAEKHIVSPVAGCADILVVPNLESGNILAKQLTFLGGADAAGVVLGARVPIILTSRADSERTRLASCAVAVLAARRHPQALATAMGR